MAPQFILYCVVIAFSVSSVSAEASWSEKLLVSMNQKRELHGVPPLKYSDWLAKGSQAWADHLAEVCDGSEHTPEDPDNYPDLFKNGIAAGETLFGGSASEGADIRHLAETINAADYWYAENTSYNYDDGSSIDGKETEHFTQMVWKDTQEVGFGLSTCKNNWFVVARYFPPGNGGYITYNVFPPKSK